MSYPVAFITFKKKLTNFVNFGYPKSINEFSDYITHAYTSSIVENVVDLSLNDGLVEFDYSVLQSSLSTYLEDNLSETVSYRTTDWLGKALVDFWRHPKQFSLFTPFPTFVMKLDSRITNAGQVFKMSGRNQSSYEGFVDEIVDISFKHFNTLEGVSTNVSALGVPAIINFKPIVL